MDFRIWKLEAGTLQNKASEELEGSRGMEPSTGQIRNISSVLLPMQSRFDGPLSGLGWTVCILFLIAPSGGTNHLRQETDVGAKPAIQKTWEARNCITPWLLHFKQMKNKNVITNLAQGRQILGKQLTSLLQDWALPHFLHLEQESGLSHQEEEAQMQQLTSGKLSSPQQHLLDKNSTSLPLKKIWLVFNNIHSSHKLLKETQNKYNVRQFVHKPPLITMFFQNIFLSPGQPSSQPLSLYLWTQNTNSVLPSLGP